MNFFILAIWFLNFFEYISVQNIEEIITRDFIQIELNSGILQGNIKTFFTDHQRIYYNFQGIPYGLPPVGKLRFQDPIPLKKWYGILNATNYGPSCVEILLRQISFTVSGQEDCLYLNLYTPQNPLKIQQLLPVMVWIYGGSYREGSSNFYDPQYLMTENNVIVITFNYRLGVFGFLSTQDEIAPGNYGLKDILLVLKWIQENVMKFGGDPKRVTLFGESAGAAIAAYLMITPKSKNLFSAAIMESGSPLCIWAFHRNARRVAFDMGLAFGKFTNNSSELIQFLREVDLENAGDSMIAVNIVNLLRIFDNGGPFGPVIEPASESAILTVDSYYALQNGLFHKVPILMGVNSQESKFFTSLMPIIRPSLFLYDISPSSLARTAMNVKSMKEKREVGTKIKEYYFKSATFLGASDKELADYFSDDFFIRPITKTARFFAKYVPVYFYVFDFNGKMGNTWLDYVATKNKNVKGVAHATEVWYLWRGRWTNQQLKTDSEILTKNRLVKLWTNFATSHNPTPNSDYLFDYLKWPKIDTFNVRYFHIGKDLKIGNNFKRSNIDFWDNLYGNYSDGPFFTY